MSKQVLIVDDSAVVRRQVKKALASAGFEIIEAVDGRDGVSKIQRNDGLAAVICDVNMPNMSGIELLEEVRPADRGLPVVMLTTEGQPDLIQRAKKAGARGWIVKPFKPAMLLAAITKLAS